MPDYRKMYLKMIDSTEQAIQILIDAQRQCEEMYIDSSVVTVLPIRNEEQLETAPPSDHPV